MAERVEHAAGQGAYVHVTPEARVVFPLEVGKQSRRVERASQRAQFQPGEPGGLASGLEEQPLPVRAGQRQRVARLESRRIGRTRDGLIGDPQGEVRAVRIDDAGVRHSPPLESAEAGCVR